MPQLLSDPIRRAERLFPESLAVVDRNISLTYAELARRCRLLAGALREAGVGHGDRVAVLMANRHEYLQCYFGISGSGAVVVPLNNRLAIPRLEYILQDAEVHTLITDDNYADVGAQLTGSVNHVVSGGDEFEGWLAASPELALGGEIGEDDLAGLFYTGGTTGIAKGVMLSHRNLVANALHMAIALGYHDRDRYLHVAPMFHLADGSSTFALTWVGGCHVFVPAFDPEAVNLIIGKERVTVTLMVPTMLTTVLNHPSVKSADFSSLRLLFHGVSPMSTSLLKQGVDTMACSFFQGYGMTEAAPLVTVLPHEEELVDDPRVASVGREAVGVQVSVRRSDGTACGPNEVGEVVACGPNFTSGYWKKPDLSAEVLRNGWYWTSDLGYLTSDGYLFLVDRVKDMIISGGENVYSIEVEEAISSHPSVLEVAVIGVPDDRWGESVHAVVVLREGAELDLSGIRTHCTSLIADFKRPRSIELIDQLPRNGAGKVLKRSLRAKHWEGLSREIH